MKILLGINLYLSLFPYFQVVPGFYNQPYYLVSNILLFFLISRHKIDYVGIWFFLLAILGSLLFLVTSLMFAYPLMPLSLPIFTGPCLCSGNGGPLMANKQARPEDIITKLRQQGKAMICQLRG